MESIIDPFCQQVLRESAQGVVAFGLVVARLAGLFVWGPVFGHQALPLKFRALLVLALALVVTPALLPMASRQPIDGLGFDRLAAGPPLIGGDVADLVRMGAGELMVGLALGLGMQTILSGMQMAGRLIDQQIGTSLAEVFNPELGGDVSLSGQLLHQLGLLVFLLIGGHLLIVAALLDTFQSLPIGAAGVGPPMFELLTRLVQQSLMLALQVSAPVLATLAVVGLALGVLGRAAPQINVLMLGFPVRALVGLLVLGSTALLAGDLLADVVPEAVLQLRRAVESR